jgi:hypothetical protein
MNTDLSTSGGIHWIVLMPINNYLYICDPLGMYNYRPYDNIMFNTINELELTPYFYKYKIQMKNSVHCGWFSIYIAKLLNSIQSPTIQKCDNTIYNQFGHTADIDDEKVLIKNFGLSN